MISNRLSLSRRSLIDTQWKMIMLNNAFLLSVFTSVSGIIQEVAGHTPVIVRNYQDSSFLFSCFLLSFILLTPLCASLAVHKIVI